MGYELDSRLRGNDGGFRWGFTNFGYIARMMHAYQSFESKRNALLTNSAPETLALLTILALGNREIEHGRFRAADDVFADLDEIRLNDPTT